MQLTQRDFSVNGQRQHGDGKQNAILLKKKEKGPRMDYKERLALAKNISNMPVKDNMPGQKFPRGTKVRVGEMPPYKSHFDANFDGIIEHTYAQKFGGYDIENYCLIQLKNGKPVNSIAWYQTDQITFIGSDTQAGIKIIEEYENQPSITIDMGLSGIVRF